jgi:TPR repeat protein
MALKAAGSPRKIFAETLKLANMGSREAQYQVGLMYANGAGVVQDLSKAIEWVTKAAQKGLPAAQYLLGTRYASGIVVSQDERAALWWYHNAAEQGHAKAQFKLGRMLTKPLPQAGLNTIRLAAEQGLSEAQFALGQALANGDGTSEDPAQAFDWYQRAALQGLPAAQCALAEMYEIGLGVAQDIEQAFDLYRKAAGQSYPKAQLALEYLAAKGGRQRRGRKKPSAAERRMNADRWLRAAEGGDADVKYHVGLMHDMGLGTEQDARTAKDLYLAAARLGHDKAQVALAALLEVNDPEAAKAWLEKAAAAGNVDAQFALGQLYGRAWEAVSRGKALTLLVQAAQAGHAHAQLAVAKALETSAQGYSLDFLEMAAHQGVPEAQYLHGCRLAEGALRAADRLAAAQWWERAATAGNIAAASDLGGALLGGDGVTKNPAEALHWIKLAAEAGDAKAQWNLGGMYIGGAGGLSQDIKQAFIWCHLAADQGFAPARATLGVLYEKIGKFDKAVQLLRQAADAGDAEAQYNLAMMYRSGKGVEKNLDASFVYFCLAAEQGVSSAQVRLALAYGAGEGVAADPIEAHKWLLAAQAAGDSLAKANLAFSLTQLNLLQVKEATRRAQKWLKASL